MSAWVVPALCALISVCVFFSAAAGAARWQKARRAPEPTRDSEGYVWS